MEPTFPVWQVDSLTTEPPGKVTSHFGLVLKGNVCCCWFGSKGKFCPLIRKWRDVRSDSFEKTLLLGKIEGRRGRQEDEMVGRHHCLNGHGLGGLLELVTPGGLACCGSWGRKESDTTERVN